MNLWSALNLGKTSINTQQQIFQVIGQNLANVNTPGYSKQYARLTPVTPTDFGQNTVGRGVSLKDIQSVRDPFINGQIVGAQKIKGKYDKLASSLRNVESIFDESKNMGLSDLMTDFFSAWSDLSNNPNNIAVRNNLISVSDNYIDTLHRSYNSLVDEQTIADSAIATKVEEVNSLADEIAELNKKITQSIGAGAPSSELRDLRENKLKEISKLIGTNIYPDANNESVTVEVAGRPLVTFDQVNHLSVQREATGAQYYNVLMEQFSATTVDITDQIKGGEIDALLETRDLYIPKYKDEMNTLVTGLVYNVNKIHQQGYALDGVTTGKNFFKMFEGEGQINTIAGTTLTFNGLTGNISDDLKVGDIISVNGQTKMITGVTNPSQITIDSAFDPDISGSLPHDWSFLNKENVAAVVEIDDEIKYDSTLIAASGEALWNGPGTLDSITGGVNLTFSSDISSTLNVGDSIVINGQEKTIVSITPPSQIEVDSAFNPVLSGFPINWSYKNGTGADSNNEIALQLAALSNSMDVVDKNGDGVLDYGSFHEYLHNSLNEIGNDTAQAVHEAKSNEAMLTYLNNVRDSISGVSIDEETAELLKAEKAYQGIARFMGSVNQMMDILVQLGR